MMRTTNKVFKEQIQKHITESFGEEINNVGDLITRFESEKWWGNEIKHYRGNKEAAFKDWLGGLPSAFNLPYMNEDIHNTLRSWYENAGTQYDEKKLQTDEYEWYHHLVTREVKTLAKKNGIQF